MIGSNGKVIKVSSFKKAKNGSYRLGVSIDTKTEAYDISIMNRDGIFAVDLPSKLALRLRDYPVKQSKDLIATVKEQYILLNGR